MPARAASRPTNLTLRTHPIGVNQTDLRRATRARPGARPGLPYFAVQLPPAAAVWRRVQKVSIDAGFTCPNVDGTVATGGCTFCDNRSFSPSRRLPRAGIRGQIDQSIARMRLRYRKCQRLPGLLSAGHEHLRAGRATAAVV